MALHSGSGVRIDSTQILSLWRDWFDPTTNQGSLDTVTIPSAAYTAITRTSATLTSPMWARGLLVYVNITAIGATATVTVTIQGVEPTGGTNVYTILASTALSANAFTILRIYPGLTASANLIVSDVVPAQWNIKHVVATATSTYSIAYSYVP